MSERTTRGGAERYETDRVSSAMYWVCTLITSSILGCGDFSTCIGLPTVPLLNKMLKRLDEVEITHWLRQFAADRASNPHYLMMHVITMLESGRQRRYTYNLASPDHETTATWIQTQTGTSAEAHRSSFLSHSAFVDISIYRGKGHRLMHICS